MVGLRQVGADAVGCGGCGNGWISYGHAADLGRSGHISLQERRRDFENVGDVVKTITGIIAGEKQARVDLQTDQVANDIAVLRAIQAVQCRRSRIWLGRRCAIQCRFQRHRKTVQCCAIRPPRSARRHHSGTQLPDDFFPGFGILTNVLDIQLV